MRLRVAHKLFLLLMLIVTVSLGALGTLAAINLHQGFVGYINQLDLQRLQPLASALDQQLQQGRSLSRFRTPDRWQTLLHKSLFKPIPPAPPPPVPATPGPPSAPPPPPPPPSPAATLAPRITLQDAAHHTLAGPPAPPDALLRRLRAGNGVTLGWLALRPLHAVTSRRDTAFLRQQLRAMAWTGVVLLLLALGVAFGFAKYMMAPLRRVTDATARLAAGDFGVRLHSQRRDELGDLERHVNAMATALAQHEHVRRRWMADMSHELRTPLSILRGELESMLDGVTPADPASIQSLHEEIMRMQRLVDDLHQVTVTDLSMLDARRQPTDLTALARAAAERFEVRMQQAGLTLTTTLDATPADVMLDPDRIRQLLYNLLQNSLRYTDPGGRVRLALHQNADTLHLTVEDSAPGIPHDAHSRVFEPLYRVEASRNRQLGGSGLGLSICRSIVQAHGGRIEVGASTLGGLRIEIHLPTHRS